MSDIAAQLRYEQRRTVTPVVNYALNRGALEWITAVTADVPSGRVREALIAVGFLDEAGQLTEPGSWVRDATASLDAAVLTLRQQRGKSTRSLDIFLHEGLAFLVADECVEQSKSGVQAPADPSIGYAAVADLLSVIVRWLPLEPHPVTDDSEVDLSALMERVRDIRGDVTLTTLYVGQEALFDLVFECDRGFSLLQVVGNRAAHDGERPPAMRRAVSVTDLLHLLVDVLYGPE